MRFPILVFSTGFLVLSCGNNSVAYYLPGSNDSKFIHKDGKTLDERFALPEGYSRTQPNGISDYLRKLPLKPDGADVLHYDGTKKYKNVHAAVVDMEIGDKNLQQCADAVMRLHAEYLYSTKQYDKIHFNFTSGFNAEYRKWMEGYRIQVKGNNVQWVKTEQPKNDRKSFRQYLDIVFSYAGTLSLSKELVSINMKDIQPGDVFIKGGSPGHAVTIMDVAENKQGKKIFMIAQSYMPAQEIEVLINPDNKELSPWYEADTTKFFVATPEWEFTADQLKRFRD